jgi:SAM-dependent methyltransferase
MLNRFLRAGYKDVKDHVLQHGCCAPEENLRIYEKWFKNAPRYVFRAVDQKYHISQKTVIDVGCEYGMNLLHCGPGSYGIELNQYCLDFAASLGLHLEKRNIDQDDLTDLPKADVVWCSAVLEHVDSPHIVLRKLYGLLRPNGLLCVFVPTISPFRCLRRLPVIGNYFDGYLYGDHVNAFTPATLQFMCERAGFKTLELSAFYPGLAQVFNRFPLTDGVVYVGSMIPGWSYPPGACRVAAENRAGYVRPDYF